MGGKKEEKKPKSRRNSSPSRQTRSSTQQQPGPSRQTRSTTQRQPGPSSQREGRALPDASTGLEGALTNLSLGPDRESQQNRSTYSTGQYGGKDRDKQRLEEKFKRPVSGQTHQAEHPIGVQPLYQTSDLKRGEAGRASRLENIAPAYQEQLTLHRGHVGTGTRNSKPNPDGSKSRGAQEYRDEQRSFIEKGDVSTAVQINQEEYSFDPRVRINNRESEIADDSYRNMVNNMDRLTYAQGDRDVTVNVDERQRREMLLARIAARTGEWPIELAEQANRELEELENREAFSQLPNLQEELELEAPESEAPQRPFDDDELYGS